MEIKIGYVYHIRDEYYKRMGEPELTHLSQNKGGGRTRPVVACLVDSKDPRIFWCVPISTQVETARARIQLDTERYNRNLRELIGNWKGHEAAFLIGNLFPICEDNIDHQHLTETRPARVHYKILDAICTRIKSIFEITARGKTVARTDIILLRANLVRDMKQQQHDAIVASGMVPAPPRRTTSSQRQDNTAALSKDRRASDPSARNVEEQTLVSIQLTHDECRELLQILDTETLQYLDKLKALDEVNTLALPNLAVRLRNKMQLLDQITSKISDALSPSLSLAQRMAEAKRKATYQKPSHDPKRDDPVK